MKIRITSLFVFLCLVTFAANAQLLWKISGNGLAKPSYLFGTHHLIDKDSIPGIDKIVGIAQNADAVVGEMDMSDMESVKSKLMQASMMTGTTYNELYSPADYGVVDKELKSTIGVGLDRFGILKPMAIYTSYVLISYLRAVHAEKQPLAIDIVLQDSAKAHGKAVLGLESPDFQANILFNSFPLKRQAEILLEAIKDKDKANDEALKLNEVYLKGDLKGAEALHEEDNSMTPEEDALLITNRNDNWVNELPALMQKQSCFVAVGFLHLVGEKGLVNQLKKTGYTLEPVNL